MIPKSRKRKQRQENATHTYGGDAREAGPAPPDPALFIQAHEADLIRGPQASQAAISLEVEFYEDGGKRRVRVGDGLIEWKGIGGGNGSGASDTFEEEHVQLGYTTSDPEKVVVEEEEGVWVDRYDARLLLDGLPVTPHVPDTRPNSPGGWSDLPSDTEDIFFFSAEEVEDYRREKRRRLIDQGREDRLRALRAEAGEDQAQDAEDEEWGWGGSDEEPDENQKELMRRTASHILTSPNPAQLEMRILANHGADRRFAFLRGRWSRAWRIMKSYAREEMEREKVEKETEAHSGVGLGGLTGYGDSEEESLSSREMDKGTKNMEDAKEEEKEVDHTMSPHAEVVDDADENMKKARRARAKEWAQKRRASNNVDDDPGALPEL